MAARTALLSCGAFLCALVAPTAALAAAPARETVPGGALMLAAYVCIWALPLAFLWMTTARLSRTEQATRELRALIDRRAAERDP